MAYLAATQQDVLDENGIDETDLQRELDTLEGTGKVTVTTNDDNTLNVYFTETNHNYTVDSSGNIEKYEEPGLMTVAEAKSEGIVFTAKTTLIDDYDNRVVVPQGFKVAPGNNGSGTNIKDGVVIEDSAYNQYVWIPVGTGLKISETETVDIILGRYIFGNGGVYSPITNQDYYEGLKNSTTTNTHAKDIEMFISSVNANFGYYIARYEASYRSSGKAGSIVSTGTIPTSNPSSRAEGQLWNFVTQSEASTACQDLYAGVINSDLINSYAWDTALVYIQTMGHSNYSNYKNLKYDNTGTTGDEVCKIFDMSSNCREWTTETNTSRIADRCTLRGGEFFATQGANSGQRKLFSMYAY